MPVLCVVIYLIFIYITNKMIISHKFKCIFIRIPKTGSTSIETFLMQLDPNCISSDNTKSPYGHFTASEVREMVSQNIWETYFKFTFVREPLSWFKSQYADHMQYSHKTTPLGVNYLLLDKDQQIRKPSENCLGVDHVCTMFHSTALKHIVKSDF